MESVTTCLREKLAVTVSDSFSMIKGLELNDKDFHSFGGKEGHTQ